MSVARTTNSATVYGVVTIAAIGVGAVIIPCSIIAQIVSPPELIGTITAITLSIRYVGGAIGFTAYYNIFSHKFLIYAKNIVAIAIVEAGIASPLNVPLITDLIALAAEAEYVELRQLIALNPDVGNKAMAFDVIIAATQEAFALAYRWPFWMSIAFGAICLLCSLGLKDIRQFM